MAVWTLAPVAGKPGAYRAKAPGFDAEISIVIPDRNDRDQMGAVRALLTKAAVRAGDDLPSFEFAKEG